MTVIRSRAIRSRASARIEDRDRDVRDAAHQAGEDPAVQTEAVGVGRDHEEPIARRESPDPAPIPIGLQKLALAELDTLRRPGRPRREEQLGHRVGRDLGSSGRRVTLARREELVPTGRRPPRRGPIPLPISLSAASNSTTCSRLGRPATGRPGAPAPKRATRLSSRGSPALSRSMKASRASVRSISGPTSAAFQREASGTTTAPSCQIPQAATTQRQPFEAQIATRSPGRIPAACSARATRSASAKSDAKSSRTSPSTTASQPAWR